MAVIEADAAGPAISRGTRPLEFSVRGARCASCLGKIEREIAAIPGVASARLNLTSGRLTVQPTPKGRPPAAQVIERLEALGYEAALFCLDHAGAEADAEGRRLLFALGVAAFGAGNVMMFSVPVWAGLFGQELDSSTRALMYGFAALVAAPCALFAARPFFASAWRSLRKGRANMDVPISIGVILTLLVSFSELFRGGAHAYFDAAVTLVFFLLAGRWLDHRLRRTAGSAASDLLALQSPTVRRLDAERHESLVAVAEVAVGDLIAVTPGDRVGLDGVVESGLSQLDNALITGETDPVSVGPGVVVHAGALSLSGRLIIRVTARSEDSSLIALARLMEAGAQSRSRYVVMADKAAALYVPVIHSLAAATLFGGLMLGLSLRESVVRAATVLIVTCPCALGLAAPAVQITACGRLFRKGVLVKSGAALERLAEVDYVVFDKTGVLTQGRPAVVGATRQMIEMAAPLARGSRHPLALAIVEAAGPGPVAEEVVEIPGMGVTGMIEGRRARLGRAAFVGIQHAGSGAELWFAFDQGTSVKFRFAEKLREDAARTISALKARGLGVEILSGDGFRSVERAAQAVGVETWAAGLLPTEKTAAIEALTAAGHKVLMVGDGLNDAAALAGAHASIAPGSAVEASQNAADLVLCDDGLWGVVRALDVARAARRRARENFGFSALYNLVAGPAAVLGLVNPLIAALAMSGSSIAVTLNAARLALSARDRA